MFFLREHVSRNRLQKSGITAPIHVFLRQNQTNAPQQRLQQTPTKARHRHQTGSRDGACSFYAPVIDITSRSRHLIFPPMLTMSEIKPGKVLKLNEAPYVVVKTHHTKQARSGAVLWVKMKNLLDGAMLEKASH